MRRWPCNSACKWGKCVSSLLKSTRTIAADCKQTHPNQNEENGTSTAFVSTSGGKTQEGRSALPKLVKDVAADGDRLEVLGNGVERVVTDRANGAGEFAAVHHRVRWVVELNWTEGTVLSLRCFLATLFFREKKNSGKMKGNLKGGTRSIFLRAGKRKWREDGASGCVQ